MVVENVTMAARLEGISSDPFMGICISNVTIGMSQFAKKLIWNCDDVEGGKACDFLEEKLPVEDVKVHMCYYKPNYI
ncbi:hypothetical protein Hanom_Chr03g00216211 [Helianthus anomalus]